MRGLDPCYRPDRVPSDRPPSGSRRLFVVAPLAGNPRSRPIFRHAPITRFSLDPGSASGARSAALPTCGDERQDVATPVAPSTRDRHRRPVLFPVNRVRKPSVKWLGVSDWPWLEGPGEDTEEDHHSLRSAGILSSADRTPGRLCRLASRKAGGNPGVQLDHHPAPQREKRSIIMLSTPPRRNRTSASPVGGG